jgi:hypothetical protein
MIPKRTQGKLNADFGNRDAYEHFCAVYPELAKTVSAQKHRTILQKFHLLLMHKMIYEAYIFTMPSMGTISVQRRKIKIQFKENGKLKTHNLPVDYNATRKLWERDPVAASKKQVVFFLNDHTDGWRYTWHWTRTTKKNLASYRFIPCRRMKRELAKALKDVYNDLSYFGK